MELNDLKRVSNLQAVAIATRRFDMVETEWFPCFLVTETRYNDTTFFAHVLFGNKFILDEFKFLPI